MNAHVIHAAVIRAQLCKIETRWQANPNGKTFMQVALVAAHDAGLVSDAQGNEMSAEFGLGLKW